MNKKEILTYGPWPKGANLKDDYRTLGKDELAYAENVEINEKGWVQLRRPFRKMYKNATTRLVCNPLGLVPERMGQSEVVANAIIHLGEGDALTLSWPNLDPDAGLGLFDSAVLMGGSMFGMQYGFIYSDRYYVIPKGDIGPATAQYSDPIPSSTRPYTWHSVTTGPIAGKLRADAYAIYTNRLFVAYGNSVYFSVAGDFLNWTIPSGGAQGPFGGVIILGNTYGTTNYSKTNVKFMHIMNDTLYMFTKYETYSWTYNEDPNSDAVLQLLTKRGANVAVWFRDQLYCVCDDGLYLFLNNIYYPIDVKINIKWHGVVGIQGFEDYLIIHSTVPTEEFYIIKISDGSYAVSKWDLPGPVYDPAEGQTFQLGIPGSVMNLETHVQDTLYSYLVISGFVSNADWCVPNVYNFIPEDEFYDDKEGPEGIVESYDAKIVLPEVNDQSITKYQRIYYCSMSGTAHGLYDGSVFLADVETEPESVKVGFQIDHTIKKNYPMDRSRTIQPTIKYVPTDVISHTRGSTLGLKFELHEFQLVVKSSDVQQGEQR